MGFEIYVYCTVLAVSLMVHAAGATASVEVIRKVGGTIDCQVMTNVLLLLLVLALQY